MPEIVGAYGHALLRQQPPTDTGIGSALRIFVSPLSSLVSLAYSNNKDIVRLCMRTAEQSIKRWKRVVVMVGLLLCAGCGLGSFTRPRPPRFIQVVVDYLPYFVKGNRPQFLPARVLVLLPVDKRNPYPVKMGGVLPASQDNTAILGILGINSQEGVVRISPPPELYPQVPQTLGAQRRMKAGVLHDPDIARGIFTLTGLPRIVQDALASHFQEAGFPVQKVGFSSPSEPGAASEPADYALGCAIEQFSLVSLERHKEVVVYAALYPHFIDV